MLTLLVILVPRCSDDDAAEPAPATGGGLRPAPLQPSPPLTTALAFTSNQVLMMTLQNPPPSLEDTSGQRTFSKVRGLLLQLGAIAAACTCKGSVTHCSALRTAGTAQRCRGVVLLQTCRGQQQRLLALPQTHAIQQPPHHSTCVMWWRAACRRTPRCAPAPLSCCSTSSSRCEAGGVDIL